MSDPYKVLGIMPDATDEQVKKAYRTMAKKYHPDLHPGDKQAEEKMKEINEAYDRIKSGNISGDSDTGRGGSYSSYGSYNGYGSWGAYGAYGRSYGDYGYSGYRNTGRTRTFSRSEFNAAYSYILASRFSEALRMLASVSEQNAEWYYLSALANYGIGNRITALQHAKKAVELDPADDDYVYLADMMEIGGRRYTASSSNYKQGGLGLGGLCLGYCLLQLFCCR